MNKRWLWNPSAYRASFPPPCTVQGIGALVAGEATPDYFASGLVAQRIAIFTRSHPGATKSLKLIFLLRDPISRFISRLVGNLEHQPMRKWRTCQQLVNNFKSESQKCDGATMGCITDRYGSSGFLPVETDGAVSTGCYIAILMELWSPYFDISGADGQVLVMPSEFFSPETSHGTPHPDEQRNVGRTDERALNEVARFLGISPWTTTELDRRSSLHSHQGTSHSSHYKEAVQNRTSSWAKLYANKLHSDSWACTDGMLEYLMGIYDPFNRALAGLLYSAPWVTTQDVASAPVSGEKKGAWPWPPYLMDDASSQGTAHDGHTRKLRAYRDYQRLRLRSRTDARTHES